MTRLLRPEPGPVVVGGRSRGGTTLLAVQVDERNVEHAQTAPRRSSSDLTAWGGLRSLLRQHLRRDHGLPTSHCLGLKRVSRFRRRRTSPTPRLFFCRREQRPPTRKTSSGRGPDVTRGPRGRFARDFVGKIRQQPHATNNRKTIEWPRSRANPSRRPSGAAVAMSQSRRLSGMACNLPVSTTVTRPRVRLFRTAVYPSEYPSATPSVRPSPDAASNRVSDGDRTISRPSTHGRVSPDG